MIPAIFLMGPTASGKTELAVRLADALPIDIISVDSLLAYRHFDIGSAKPSLALRRQYPHALVDIREPDEPYSAGLFREDALRCIVLARERGRIPLLVGGTGLYFRALERGIDALPPANPALRQSLMALAEEAGWSALHQRLATLDPETAAGIAPHDRQRIQRALEIILGSGQAISGARHWQGTFPGPLYKIILRPPRGWLHQRIMQRFDVMLNEGFLDEIADLSTRHYAPELPAMRAVGYRQYFAWHDGLCSSAEAYQAALAATRQLAKRQDTWFKRESAHYYLDPSRDDASSLLLQMATRPVQGEVHSIGGDNGGEMDETG
ncbi:tRNA (adenosine(37)-N6)-dimethylallyltransferase MiaA [Acidithiobacillus ferridurans]|jgi:tRNA dimethylallyltransferase|uniref:tRNA (adenosine(37)-N6)-dimethylallyltransferase MiaA n=1 Tax=Acidithiobacillus ferridurans TaxID=1232575 RepID=UPI001C0658B8|nr:tRNA (adenosine(37)-N6)-dimethylallyltransferase MiaA [Acidithiobacillus ferridurans]MBU2803943.1 tRNA (adenosine(37)-N6)-dimethylallyltransferase MiaA [Acidithiobacillus ferridurans]